MNETGEGLVAGQMQVSDVVARRIENLRADLRLSQKAFAEGLHAYGLEKWDQTVVSTIENGARAVKVEELAVISTAYRAPIMSFFVPLVDDADGTITFGDTEVDALQFLEDTLAPPEDRADLHPDTIAYHMILEAPRRGKPEVAARCRAILGRAARRQPSPV
jgi:transcriptional regulator with XRE-family HTH domain